MKQIKSLKIEAQSMNQQVLAIFQDMNKLQSASKTQLFELVKLFRNSPIHFQQAWQLAYLKIFKIFHERANRKMPPKFEQLATNFFAQLLPPSNHSDPPAEAFFDFFLQFLAEAVFSSLTGIRITAARMLFHLLKAHGKVSQKSQQKILKSVYFLIRLKVSTYKQIGIKLASIVLGWEGPLKDKVEDELFKIMAIDENEQIRRMAITNLWINKNNLDRVLVRLRDKCPDIRSIILRKLLGQKFSLEQTTTSHRYKLLYDGYANKESSVQQDTVKFLLKYFDEQKSTGSFSTFVEMFSPNTLLAHPHLYALFDLLIIDMVEEMPHNQISEFIRKFTSQLKTIGKGAPASSPLFDLIWLKNVGRSDNSELRALFEESVPSGMELARVLTELVNKQEAFSIYECLQLFSLHKSADELGRNKMFDALKKMMIDLNFWQIKREESSNDKDDICPKLTDEILRQKKLLLSYFDLPPISCSFDLLFQAGRAMKALWPDHYQIQLKQLMADWNNPEENNLLKEKELAQANIKKTDSDSRLMGALQAKLAMIEEQLQKQNAKTITVIQTIVRLRPGSRMDDYMPIIKEELSKKDQAQGLILLAYYCLQEQDRAQNFLPLYWAHIVNPQTTKLSLLISLKVATDFFVKFDFNVFKPSESESDEDPFSYTGFLRRLQEFALYNDPDTRILAIEGLCRLIFHNRVPQELSGSCFMKLLLLWWQTSSQEISARSVHIISIFIKQFIERGQQEVRKLSEWLCVFFKIVLLEQRSRKSINKKKVVYNLKMEQFIKRAVVIAMTVLKYQKESRLIIWRYQQAGAQLGPQELFLLFLFNHKELHFCLEKALNICDFYEQAPLETLILVKKQVQGFLAEVSLINAKKLQSAVKKLEADLEERIQIKNKQTFNEQLLNGLKEQLHEYELLIESAGTSLGKELQQEQIFIENVESVDDQMDDQSGDVQEEEVDDSLANLDEIINEDSKQSKKQQKEKANLGRISERIQQLEADEEQRTVTVRESDRSKKESHKRKEEVRGNRKKHPKNIQEAESPLVEGDKIKKISGRTRSRVQL